jgi:hypothetical protein
MHCAARVQVSPPVPIQKEIVMLFSLLMGLLPKIGTSWPGLVPALAGRE